MYEENIARGIQRLTEHRSSQWIELVNWDELCMESFTMCVIGQLVKADPHSWYEEMLRTLKIERELSDQFGFDVPIDDLIPINDDQTDDERYDEIFGALTREWKKAIVIIQTKKESVS